MGKAAGPLRLGDIWEAMLAALRPQFWTLVTLAAPFTLLVDMALAVFGPEAPKSLVAMTPKFVVMQVLIPGLIGTIGSLVAARLLVRPGEAPRAALAAALATAPGYIVAIFVAALPFGIAMGLLQQMMPFNLAVAVMILPLLYVSLRMFVLLPVAADQRGTPLAMLRRSWQLTAAHTGTLAMLFGLGLLFLLGATLIAGGVGAAVGSVIKLIGLGAVGAFFDTLVTASLACAMTVVTAAAAAVVYLKVR